MQKWLGISLGDPRGIGFEVTLKALKQLPEDGWKFLLFGDIDALIRQNSALGTNLALKTFHFYEEEGRIFVHQAGPVLPLELTNSPLLAAESALSALKEAARRCLAGELKGMVTAPVNKEAIIRLGKPFTGQTELLSELAGAHRTAMMLLGEDDRGRWLRVALVTTHIPLREVSSKLRRDKIEETIELAAQACRDLGLKRERVVVCGLNPHAGEGGEIGDEEITIISPAVEAVRQRGIDVTGPIPADTLFYYAYKGDFDAVVAMYHDQGLGPLKMIGFEKGVNWTLGLPFIRTSPDHGTAFDIAGQNKANPSSMLAAINLAKKLASPRG